MTHPNVRSQFDLQCSLVSLLLLLVVSTTKAPADESMAHASVLQRDIEFSDYTPLASWSEVVTRLMSPLNGLRVKRKLTESGYSLNRQSVDLKKERFAVYVPAVEPPQGFALFVFLPPWQDARMPIGWGPTLEQNHTIFVTAERSGNSESVFDRRVPLVLLAAHNIVSRYHVDAQRIYVGGFSGGSRIAMRIALGYPDVFRGALLNAGSDPIGDSQAPLPPLTLLQLFQSSSRLQYFTGQDDAINIEKDSGSVLSMRNWCVFDTRLEVIFRQGHEVATAATLQRALLGFTKDSQGNVGRLEQCRAKVDEELSVELRRVDTEIAQGNPRGAQKILDAIDAKYGGIAAPRSEELEDAITQLTRHALR